MTARWTKRNPRWTWLAAVAILLLLDQSTKSYFSTILELGEAVRVTDLLNFVHVLNTGAAFSLLADASGWQRWFFIGVSVLVVGVVSVACLAPHVEPLDRWAGGAVVDFLDFHWRNIHWPAFNLADVFIVCAALTWCLVSLKTPPRQQPTRKSPEELPS